MKLTPPPLPLKVWISYGERSNDELLQWCGGGAAAAPSRVERARRALLADRGRRAVVMMAARRATTRRPFSSARLRPPLPLKRYGFVEPNNPHESVALSRFFADVADHLAAEFAGRVTPATLDAARAKLAEVEAVWGEITSDQIPNTPDYASPPGTGEGIKRPSSKT